MPLRLTARLFCAGVLSILFAGCAGMATQRLANNVSHAILNQDDPTLVQSGAPAYLLLIDGRIDRQPRDIDLLIAGARLYSAYAGVFVDDPERARRLAEKGLDYARRALCQRHAAICDTEQGPFDAFKPTLAPVTTADVTLLYTYGAAWAGLIQVSSGDWRALADVPKVEAVMERVIELDETYQRGQAHLYLGVMRSQLPPSLGGKPEQGRAHFERAIDLSGGRNLMAKVAFAEYYARLTFNRPLHDRLLKEVLEADPVEQDMTLSNALAQRRARVLLAGAPDYFLE